MIKLATVFSGIGAIEHALERMQIEHNIVFACDNGDVDIDIDKTRDELDTMRAALISINTNIEDIRQNVSGSNADYAEQLAHMLAGANNAMDELEAMLVANLNNLFALASGVNVDEVFSEVKKLILEQSKRCTTSKKKKYNEILECFDLENLSEMSKRYLIVRAVYHFQEDEVTIDDNIRVFLSTVNNEVRRIVKQGKDIKERINMLYDKIFYLGTSTKLSELATYAEKKEFVDNLYRGKEKSNKVRESYLANYDLDPQHFHWNVAFLDGTQYENQVDLFVGGSPCQSFSLVGKQRGLEDTRGTLFYEYARLVKEIRPKVFIYENVKAILSNDDGKTWKKMQEVFDGLGYNVFYTQNGSPSVLNAKNYGIPQNRERMFVVGFREDLALEKTFEFPAPIPLKMKMQDLLIDNASGRYYLPQKGVDFVTNAKNLEKRYTQIDGEIALCQKKNQQFNWHGDFVFVEENKDMERTMEELDKYFLSEKVVKYVLSPGTKNFYCRPQTDLEIARPLLTTMHKMHRAGVDNYVHTNGRLRKLTPRECLRLMGFCDSFKIVVSDTAMYQQAGNSIVVDVLIHIMNSILDSYPKFATDPE